MEAKQPHPMCGTQFDRPLMTSAIEVVGTGPLLPPTPDEHRSVPLEHQREHHLQQSREPVDELAPVWHVVQDDGLETAVLLVAQHHSEGTVGSVFETEHEVDDVAREAGVGERQVPRVLREIRE